MAFAESDAIASKSWIAVMRLNGGIWQYIVIRKTFGEDLWNIRIAIDLENGIHYVAAAGENDPVSVWRPSGSSWGRLRDETIVRIRTVDFSFAV